MRETAYCYHCGRHHPIAEMRRVRLKSGVRWRCLRSIEATRAAPAQREAFGQRMTALNRALADERRNTPQPGCLRETAVPGAALEARLAGALGLRR